MHTQDAKLLCLPGCLGTDYVAHSAWKSQRSTFPFDFWGYKSMTLPLSKEVGFKCEELEIVFLFTKKYIFSHKGQQKDFQHKH